MDYSLLLIVEETKKSRVKEQGKFKQQFINFLMTGKNNLLEMSEINRFGNEYTSECG